MEKGDFIRGWLLILLAALLLSVPAGYEISHFAKWLFATSFVNSLAWSTVLLWLIDRNRFLKSAFFTIIFVLFFLETACYLLFGSRLNETIVTIILQTDLQEAHEFVSTYLLSWRSLVLLVGGCVCYYVLMRVVLRLRLTRLFQSWGSRILVLVVVVVGFVLPRAELSWSAQGFNTVDELYHSFKFVRESHSDLDHIARMMERIHIAESPDEAKAPVIVFVIGESYNKYHSQLYGYPLQTTPSLAAEKNMVVFDHARTPVCYTHHAMRYIFSLNSCDRSQDDSLQYVLFPAVFKKAGYKVAYFDNQYTRLKVSFMDYGCGYFFSPTSISVQCFDVRNTSIHSYDGDFVDQYSPLFIKDPKSLNIIHLMGQHSEAEKRYPPEAGVFRASDIQRKDLDEEERQIVAEYDNATLYNDAVLSTIIDAFRSQDAVLVYLSDHGDNVFDGPQHRYGRDAGGLDDEESKRNIREIPFLIWCSEKFVKRRPALYETLRQRAHWDVCSDDVAYLLFELGGISFNMGDSTRSLSNEQYQPHVTAIE